MKFNIRESIITILIVFITTIVSALFYMWKFSNANIIMLFILGVILTAIYTSGYKYCIISSIISILLFNFFFTQPIFSFSTYDKQYPATFVIMFAIALLAGTQTARLKKQMALLEESSMLAQKEKIRSSILRSVSHDLRTPLTSIAGCANSLLENKWLDDETKAEMLTDIKNDANWLIRLVENLLSITKIDEGQLIVDKVYEAVEEILAQTLERSAQLLEKRMIKTELPKELMLVPMNGNLIIQVLLNLIENAVKHTSDGSLIQIIVLKQKKNAVFIVSDKGEGIKEIDLPHIFEMFYTSEKISDSRRGVGLGLAICKAIIEAHGGSIWAENNPDGGAKITFTLPIGDEVNE